MQDRDEVSRGRELTLGVRAFAFFTVAWIAVSLAVGFYLAAQYGVGNGSNGRVVTGRTVGGVRGGGAEGP